MNPAPGRNIVSRAGVTGAHPQPRTCDPAAHGFLNADHWQGAKQSARIEFFLRHGYRIHSFGMASGACGGTVMVVSSPSGVRTVNVTRSACLP